MFVCDPACLCERVENPGIEITSLQMTMVGAPSTSAGWSSSTVFIGPDCRRARSHRVGPGAEEADGAMMDSCLFSMVPREAGRPEVLFLDVPAPIPQQFVPGGCKGGRVRHPDGRNEGEGRRRRDPSSCLAQSPPDPSTTASAGAVRQMPVLVPGGRSQSAASATGSVPPVTQPKKRPLVDPRIPPSVSRTSSLMTCSDAVDASGNGLASRERNSSSEAVVAIGRESTASRYLFACAAVISSKPFTLMFHIPCSCG